MAGIFKAYDIRGVYGETLSDDLAYRIGRAFATFTKCRKVVVGRDMRPHSQPLFDALSRGLMLQGAEVVELGLCSTPMSYHANGMLGADAGVMITASHNPPEWNGFKLCRAKAVPISGDTGIGDIERIVHDGSFDPPAAARGTVTQFDVFPHYRDCIRKFAGKVPPTTIAADMANAMGIYEARALEGIIKVDPLFDTLDGTFPNHEANPLKAETLVALQKKVRAGLYAFAAAFDGDADRTGFLDEKGDVVPMDIITALIAQSLLRQRKGVICYDLRSSWAVKEIIVEAGGTPTMCRVGHSFIKQLMRDVDAMFAGELSGHYYFRDNFYTESAAMAVICVAKAVGGAGKPLSELVKPLRRYHATGEINSEVADTRSTLDAIRRKYSGGRILELDGISVEYADWWFNVRASNTEPLVRLNLEAKSRDVMEKKRDEVLAVIRGG